MFYVKLLGRDVRFCVNIQTIVLARYLILLLINVRLGGILRLIGPNVLDLCFTFCPQIIPLYVV